LAKSKATEQMQAKSKKAALNYCRLGNEFSDKNKSKIVILPIPFDKTSTWMKGANNGPKALIESSKYLELYDIETDSVVAEEGIFTEKPIIASTEESMAKKVFDKTKELIKKKKFVVGIGGEHSVSIGLISAHAKMFPNLTVLHLDAHSDRRDKYHGSKLNHGCVIARAQEVANVVSVGIRSMDYTEKENMDPKKVFFAHQIMQSTNWPLEVLEKLSDNVYLTIDLDVFDSGIMPSTGTPEPGGLDWNQVTSLIKIVAKNKKLVGFDIVELCPDERNKAPDFLAAKLVYWILSQKFAKKATDF
jgi:agmatinase